MKIAIIGLGYVGFPLFMALTKRSVHTVLGVDTSTTRIDELIEGFDRNEEFEARDLSTVDPACLSHDPVSLKGSQVFIITVPTPVDASNEPDMSHVVSAVEMIIPVLEKGCVVVLESTVYPGVTENLIGKTIHRATGFILNVDFYLGYSPERINPGDKIHTLENVVKVVAGSSAHANKLLEQIYGPVCQAGLHFCDNIKSAEAAKVIENVQRDVNIALMNEVVQLFHQIGVDVADTLAAAKTKWNFGNYSPGLVGGHCIGVDPYYLLAAAREVDFSPQLITAGRKINSEMPRYAYERLNSFGAFNFKNLLILGFTFKADVPDFRNSLAVVLIEMISNQFRGSISCFDPYYRFNATREIQLLEKKFEKSNVRFINDISSIVQPDCIIVLTPHSRFRNCERIKVLLDNAHLVCDMQNQFDSQCFKKILL